VGLGAALGFSALSWRYFEGPISNWKQHAFRYPMASQPEVPC
jgi:peptidoglycan/LPS O-acetylase OafA/YrhL